MLNVWGHGDRSLQGMPGERVQGLSVRLKVGVSVWNWARIYDEGGGGGILSFSE
jgi:hypothetical protein